MFLLKDTNSDRVRLELEAPRSPVNHSTTEPLCSPKNHITEMVLISSYKMGLNLTKPENSLISAFIISLLESIISKHNTSEL